jgi:hypothetical protein
MLDVLGYLTINLSHNQKSHLIYLEYVGKCSCACFYRMFDDEWITKEDNAKILDVFMKWMTPVPAHAHAHAHAHAPCAAPVQSIHTYLHVSML